jgi:transposase-like protein
MAKDRIDRNELADKLVETATGSEDPLRAMAEMLADFVMEAEVTQKIGAEPHERSDEPSGYRNGHRERRWDTRLGTLTLKVPKVRDGGYVPSFIEDRKRSEQECRRSTERKTGLRSRDICRSAVCQKG